MNSSYAIQVPKTTGSQLNYRSTTVTSTGVQFGNAGLYSVSSSSSGTSNAYIIPVRIYGICNNVKQNPSYIDESGLVWETPSPLSNSFSAQTVNLDLSGAAGVIIGSADFYSYVPMDTTGMIRGDSPSSTSQQAIWRNVTVNPTGVTFATGSHINASSGATETGSTYAPPQDIFVVSNNVRNSSKYIGAIDLLWTNPDSESAFASQTIALDLTNCKGVVIKSGEFYNYVKLNTTVHLRDDRKTKTNTRRITTVTSTGVEFGTGTLINTDGSGSNSNGYVKPLEIYGVCN